MPVMSGQLSSLQMLQEAKNMTLPSTSNLIQTAAVCHLLFEGFTLRFHLKSGFSLKNYFKQKLLNNYRRSRKKT